MKLSRSTDAASMRIVTNADGSYTACSPALMSGAHVEHCFVTEAGERVRLVQQLVSLKDGEHMPCGPSAIYAVVFRHGTADGASAQSCYRHTTVLGWCVREQNDSSGCHCSRI